MRATLSSSSGSESSTAPSSRAARTRIPALVFSLCALSINIHANSLPFTGDIYIAEAVDESATLTSHQGLLIPGTYSLDGDGKVTITASPAFTTGNLYNYFFPTLTGNAAQQAAQLAAQRAALIAQFNFQISLSQFRSDPYTPGDDCAAEADERTMFQSLLVQKGHQIGLVNIDTWRDGTDGFFQFPQNGGTTYQMIFHVSSPAECPDGSPGYAGVAAILLLGLVKSRSNETMQRGTPTLDADALSNGPC